MKYDWTVEELQEIYNLPINKLVHRAQTIHQEFFPEGKIQRSTLLSVKTGGCPEDCAYCPQSSRYDTGVEKHGILKTDIVLASARAAKAAGSTRFCMGVSWRQVKNNSEFDSILELVSGVKELGMEVCCTLGMLTEDQAVKLKEAGCHAYNHNLDTSPEYYEKIISTRTYQDRLDTLKNVRKAGITVCCGGIVGMGESIRDRLGLLIELSNQNPHPESVPINLLVKVEGTPLENSDELDPIDFVRMIATARIIMPKSFVRLSAGRKQMSDELQALCFIAGANSIFAGDKLLTTDNPSTEEDNRLLNRLGLSFYSCEEIIN